MNVNTLERNVKRDINFYFRKQLETCTKNGSVYFETIKYNTKNISWNGSSLTIPTYGVYEVSWGFKQNAIDTFYNNDITELSLIIDNNKFEKVAVITKDTPSYYAMKSSCKTTTILLRESQNLSLFAENQKKRKP